MNRLTRMVFYSLSIMMLINGQQARAKTYYVATDGNDTAAGTQAAPYKTITKGLSMAGAGDTVFVKGGTYTEAVTISKSGSAGKFFILMSDPANRAVIEGKGMVVNNVSYVKVQGFKVQNHSGVGILVRGPQAEHVTISRNHTFNTVSSGISAWGVPWRQDPGDYRNIKNLIIEHNKVEKACNGGWNECITLSNGVDTFQIVHNEVFNGGDGTNGGEGIDVKEGAANGIVADNYVHGLSRRALYIDAGGLLGFTPPHCYNIGVYNNTCHSNSGCGFAIMTEGDGDVHDIKIYNNVFYSNSSDGIMYYKHPAGSGNIYDIYAVNNTCYNNGRNGILSNFSTSYNMVFRNNICYQNTSRDFYMQSGSNVTSHNLTGTDPKFVNAGNGNFHLQPGSPAIDAGTSTDAPLVDFDGRARNDGQVDMGAFEYSETGIYNFKFQIYPALPNPVNNMPYSGFKMYDITGRRITSKELSHSGVYSIGQNGRLVDILLVK